jgi:hypothetical protein
MVSLASSAPVVWHVPLVVDVTPLAQVLDQLNEHLQLVWEGLADDLVTLLATDLVDLLDEPDLLGGGTFRERRMAHAIAPFGVWSLAQ